MGSWKDFASVLELALLRLQFASLLLHVCCRRESSPCSDSDSGDEPPLKKQRPKLIDSKKPKTATDNGELFY